MKKNKNNNNDNFWGVFGFVLGVLGFFMIIGASGADDARNAYNDAFYATGDPEYDIAASKCADSKTTNKITWIGALTLLAGAGIGIAGGKDRE